MQIIYNSKVALVLEAKQNPVILPTKILILKT